ncbi:MAG: SGNH/GDSL hydrolase family protein [Flavobacteriales bacterium]|nr:SGNH/GDSL hydrolase family protein [Flavobacteriales bacterium]
MKKSLIFHAILVIFIGGIVLYTTQASGYDHEFSKVVDNLRRLFILFEVLVLLRLTLIISRSEIKEKIKNYGVGFCSLLITLMVMELVFMHIPRSYGKGDVKILSERLWFAKYWKVNSLGYRDRELDAAFIGSKKKVMVVGDSFVAGHGIEDPKDRFTDRLQAMLGDQYIVFNLGVNGADTQAAYNKLVNFPLKPDMIVLAHFTNDIERVPRRTALNIARKPNLLMAGTGTSTSGGYLIENSYLLNYFYNKFGASEIFSGEKRGVTTKEELLKPHHRDNYQSFYLDPEMRQEHLRNLYQFVLLSQQEQIPLLALLLPETWDETIDYSENYVNLPIGAFFKEHGILALDAYNLFKQTPIQERVVNSNDAHPSILMHQKIAESLYEAMSSHKLI